MTQKDSSAQIHKNADLTPYNTLGISAKAASLINITSAKQLKELFETGLFEKEEPFILGGGSNILLKGDIAGTVLKISISGISLEVQTDERAELNVGAGVNWHSLVEWAVAHNFGGIENLALIPGTVGAAPIQNIGAYGVELKDVLKSVTFFDLKTGEESVLKQQHCRFGYRDSIFKHELKGKVIITGIRLNLTKPPHPIECSYRSLDEYLRKNKIATAGIKDVFDAVIAIRKSKLPDPSLIGNAGSFFKNPVIDAELFKDLSEKFPGIPGYKISEDKVKVPAGWLIERAGWKGKRVGNVGTYENQALVLVNYGGASGEELWNHAKRIRNTVAKKFGIELVPEVNIVE